MTETILIIDDEEHFQKHIAEFLTSKGDEVLAVSTLEEARTCLKRGCADIILLDVNLPDGYGPDLLEEVAHLPLRPLIILITAYGEIDMAVDAMKKGAHDFLTKPIEFTSLEQSINRAREILAMRREISHLRQSQREQTNFIAWKNPKMQSLLMQAQRAANASVSVLITGETGTGKEVLAREIHQNGQRKDKPFIAINCAAIQSTMLESELFGYEAGAFTGAQKRKHGLMQVADEGVLFLDEIASMPVDMQAKLLRALENHSFRRVGGTNMVNVDVQILAASNRDLPALVHEGKFREDLFYRLKVVDLHLPPLRDRKDDIPELVGFFIRHYNPRMGLNVQDISPGAMAALMKHEWPGNIRELRNVIERAMLFCDDASIDLTHLPSEFYNSDG
jgi:two-component system response regulator AtoC